MKDLQGTDRGECTKCGECKEYQRAKEGNDCDYCGCKPVQHVKREGTATAAPTKVVAPPPNKVSAPPPQRETVLAPPKPTPETSVKATRPPESNIPPRPVKEAPTPETLPPKPTKAAPESFPPKPNKPAPSVVSDVIPPKPHKTAPVPGMENVPPKPVKAPPKPGDDDLYPVGIRTAHGLFFTVETFGDQLSANGATLRTKQLFMIQTDGQGRFAFKGHKGKYLSADHKDVTVGAPSKGQNEWFTLEYYNGVAAIRNSSGKYLSVDPSHNISLNSSASGNEFFEIIIDCHPQICLVNGKKFVAVEGSNVVSSRDTQFGWDTSLTMEDGPYRGSFAFRSVNGRYFNVDNSGSVVATSNDKSDQLSLFTFEFFGNNLAIKSIGTGNYLGVQGPGIKALKPTVSSKEVWKIVHSDPQVTVKASNGKYVSYQGVNLISNKDKTSNTEVFILESHGDKFSLKTVTEEYWSVDSDTITVQTKSVGPSELFTLQYIQGKIAFLGPNGKYVTSKPLGGIDAKAPSVTPESIFEVYLLNRPYVVLKTNQSSYVGATDDKVRTNKATPEGFSLHFKDGAYAIQTLQGWYLNESGDQGRICAGSEPEWFFLEFSQYSRLAIKTQRGKYLKSENQGFLVAASNTITPNELFEF